MSGLYSMTVALDKQVGNRLRKFCEPLIDNFGVNHFYHNLMTNNGYFASLGTHQEWHECVFSGSDIFLALPLHRSFKNTQGRIIFTQAVDNPYWKRIIKTAKDEFQVNLSIQLTIQTEKGLESLGFGLNTSDLHQHMAFFNKLPLIQQFLKQYYKEFKNQFLVENLVEVSSKIGPSFYETPEVNNDSISQEFLSKLCIESFSPFTKRENEVMRCLLEGYITASEIGQKLFLSKRTVEHHLEIMKEKLDCSSKSELIRKGRQLEAFGYFIH